MFLNNKFHLRSGAQQKTYQPGKLLPVLQPAVLLGGHGLQALSQTLSRLVDIPTAEYDRLYQETINRFAAFVQVLPTQFNGPLSGLLNEGCARALLMMQQVKETITQPDPMLSFASFSAALLLDVSRVLVNQSIVMTNGDGDYFGDWLPFTGDLVEQAEFYKPYELGPSFVRLDSTLTPMLAQQLLPREAFLWLSSDMALFAEWLDVLRGDRVTGGRLNHLLSLIPQDEFLKLLQSLQQVPVEFLSSPDTEFGDIFIEWLKDGIASGEVQVNTPDAGVHVVADGVFLEKQKIFHQFAEATKLPVNMNVVFRQLGNMFGIASKGGGDFLNRQYFSQGAKGGRSQVSFSSSLASQSKARSGLVIANAGLVFKNGQPPVVTTALKGASQAHVASSHQLPTSNKKNPSLTQTKSR